MAATMPVLVAGDSMLDRYWEGAVERISPEAPVPVLRLGREWDRAGGAANVAMNLVALRCPAVLATLIGDDEAGTALTALLEDAGVELLAVRGGGQVTTQKIRAVCRRQQLLRVDVEHPAPLAQARALADRVVDLLPRHRWLLLSDYGKGALADAAALVRRAGTRGCRVLVDPKGEDFDRYRGAWLLKPNEAEALRVTGSAHDEADFDTRMAALRSALEVDHLLVTRGERGLVLYSAGRAPLRVQGPALEVYDVSGAGDTVLAALACALAEGQTLDDAMAQANRAAGVVVGKFGTATVSREELADGPRSAPRVSMPQSLGTIPLEEPR
jgi:rfaE bifunctional protein kinase chain/domain